MKLTLKKLHYFLTSSLVLMQVCYPIRAIIPSLSIIFIYGLWLFITILIDKNYIAKLILNSKYIIIFTMFILIKMLLGDNFRSDFYGPLPQLIAVINLFIYYSLYLFLVKYEKKYRNKIVNIIINSLIISIIISIYYVVFKDPDAIRYAKYDLYFGVGDFELSYSIINLILIIICLMLNRYINKKYSFLLIISSIFILKANYMTAIFLTIYLIFILYFLIRNKFLIIPIHIIAITSIELIKPILIEVSMKLASLNIFSSIISNKIIAVSNLLIGYGDLDTINNRMELAKKSINTFRENILIGIDFEFYNSTTIGGHATNIDSFGRYGVIGIAIFIIIFINIYNKMIKNSHDKITKLCIRISWIYFVILGMFNTNMMSALFVIIFLISPFIYESLNLKRGSENDE